MDEVAIESTGGEINLGLDLGSFIFKNQLNVKVDSYCFSSCANYIFTAGIKKNLVKEAVVGFHGGVSSSEFNTIQLDELPEPQKTEVKN